MNEAPVRLEQRDHVLTMTLDRPEARNALDARTIEQLLAGLSQAEADPSVRAVVLTGSGTIFSAGGDLKGAAALRTDPYGAYETDGLFTTLLTRLRALAKPTVAAVNGLALGGGCGLAAACDFVVASRTAQFGTPEINVGLFPMMIMAPLVEVLGPKVALELFLTGGRLDADEARRLGLVNRVVDPEIFDHEVAAFVAPLCDKSPALVKLGKAAFYTLPGMGYEQALGFLRSMKALVGMTEDSAEGLKAFVEKRTPEWTGR